MPFCCIFLLQQVDVNTEVGVIHDYALRELRLFTDYGRTSRPLFIVEEGNQLAFKRQHLEALINK
jgi:DNA-directed RNA polymerase II subunit RPB2